MNSHKEGCGAPIFGEKACTCVDRWSPQAKLEECGNYTGDMYQDHRGGFVKFSDHQQAIREAILETRKQTQWIPVSDPPTKAGEYLVAVDHVSEFSHIESARFKMKRWDGSEYDHDWVLFSDLSETMMDYFVTHWMPLPSSPAASKPQDATATTAARNIKNDADEGEAARKDK